MKHTNRRKQHTIIRQVAKNVAVTVIAFVAIVALGLFVLHINYAGSDTQPSIVDQAIEQVAK